MPESTVRISPRMPINQTFRNECKCCSRMRSNKIHVGCKNMFQLELNGTTVFRWFIRAWPVVFRPFGHQSTLMSHFDDLFNSLLHRIVGADQESHWITADLIALAETIDSTISRVWMAHCVPLRNGHRQTIVAKELLKTLFQLRARSKAIDHCRRELMEEIKNTIRKNSSQGRIQGLQTNDSI